MTPVSAKLLIRSQAKPGFHGGSDGKESACNVGDLGSIPGSERAPGDPCVGRGKCNLPFELRRKAGDCSRVTAGPIDLI